MANENPQKLKLLFLQKFLQERTDREHPAAAAEILEYLHAQGISVERKTLYDDLAALRSFGLDIRTVRDSATRYYAAQRTFEPVEVKLLADAVQSSRFIPLDKTKTLVEKLSGLTSVYEGQQLQRQLIVANRVKAMNESIFQTVDLLSRAISGDSAVSFRYFKYNVRKQKEYRHGGKLYTVSPYALLWDDEKYYLLAYDHDAEKIKHFRADKMDQILLLPVPREGREEFKKYDMTRYSSRVFGMFGGTVTRVKIRFPERLIDPVIDRFGEDIVVIPEENGTFLAYVEAAVSPQFYGWLFGLGGGVEILDPPEAAAGMKRQLIEVYASYAGEK